jgi:putative membrane protein
MKTLALILMLIPGPALAHSGHLHWWEIGTTWTWNPLVLLPLLVSAMLYGIGTARLWRHAGYGRGVQAWQALSFAGGWLLLFGALVSPLHWLGERLFAALMVEHEVLMTLAAPLIVRANPASAIVWSLPKAWRAPTGGTRRLPAFAAAWGWLTMPPLAAALHGVALWAWHAPPLYNAALSNAFIHWLQHVSFLVTALIFWWALLRDRERGYGRAVGYLFLTALHSGFLGVLIALAPRPIYPLQSETVSQWGLAPLEDQQIAGLIMWVPAGMIYAVAALAMAGVWIATASRGRGVDHAVLR